MQDTPVPCTLVHRNMTETFTHLVTIARRSVLQKCPQVEHEVLLRLSGSTRLQKPGGGPDETELREASLDPPDHEQLPMARLVPRAKAVGHLSSTCDPSGTHAATADDEGAGWCII